MSLRLNRQYPTSSNVTLRLNPCGTLPQIRTTRAVEEWVTNWDSYMLRLFHTMASVPSVRVTGGSGFLKSTFNNSTWRISNILCCRRSEIEKNIFSFSDPSNFGCLQYLRHKETSLLFEQQEDQTKKLGTLSQRFRCMGSSRFHARTCEYLMT